MILHLGALGVPSSDTVEGKREDYSASSTFLKGSQGLVLFTSNFLGKLFAFDIHSFYIDLSPRSFFPVFDVISHQICVIP